MGYGADDQLKLEAYAYVHSLNKELFEKNPTEYIQLYRIEYEKRKLGSLLPKQTYKTEEDVMLDQDLEFLLTQIGEGEGTIQQKNKAALDLLRKFRPSTDLRRPLYLVYKSALERSVYDI